MTESTSPFVLEVPSAPKSPRGTLEGLTFAVKDNFDVAGFPTGNGSPDWRESHPIPTVTAPSVRACLAAGARLVAKTAMDELAFGLTGRNVHYGTPTNPAAPGRVPGGSSSGSAVAVAAGRVDFALGTDTGGSVRVPASFCGIWGFRPSHGAVSLDGVVPLAPSLDTVGWMARDPRWLERVGSVILAAGRAAAEPVAPWDGLVRVAEDLFEGLPGDAASALETALGSLGRGGVRVAGVRLAPGPLAEDWIQAFRVLQGVEIRACHQPWIDTVHPALAPDVAARIEWAGRLEPGRIEEASRIRGEVAELLRRATREGALLCLPAAPGPAPSVDFDVAGMEALRTSILRLTCPAGLAGTPQLVFPAARLAEGPVGLSFIGHPGSDATLLDEGIRLARSCPGAGGAPRGPAGATWRA